MKSMKKYAAILGIFILLIASIGFTIIPYFSQEGLFLPPSQDSYGLACGIENVRQGGSFFKPLTPKIYFDDFSACWTPTYLPITFFSFIASSLFHLSPILTVSLLPIFLVFIIALLVGLLGYVLYGRKDYAFILAIGTVLTNSIARSSALTPHNLYGYVIILFCLLLLFEFQKKKNHFYLIAFAVFFILLGFTHPLSFGSFATSFFLFLAIQGFKKPKVIIPLLGIFAIWMFFIFVFNDSPMAQIFRVIFSDLSEKSIGSPQSIHPLWDHPFALGYGLSLLGFLGFALLRSSPLPFKSLFGLMILVPIAYSHTSLIGFSIIPGRQLAFAWIPLLLLIPLVFQKIERIDPTKTLSTFVIILFLAGSFVQSVNHRLSDLTYFGVKIQPSRDLLDVSLFLKNIGTKNDGLFGAVTKEDKTLRALPLYYPGPVYLFPRFQFRSGPKPEPKEGSVAEKILKNDGEQTRRLADFFQIFNQPRAKSSLQLIKNYNIKYFLVLSTDAHTIQKLEGGVKKKFFLLYSNEEYAVYEIR